MNPSLLGSWKPTKSTIVGPGALAGIYEFKKDKLTITFPAGKKVVDWEIAGPNLVVKNSLGTIVNRIQIISNDTFVILNENGMETEFTRIQ